MPFWGNFISPRGEDKARSDEIEPVLDRSICLLVQSKLTLTYLDFFGFSFDFGARNSTGLQNQRKIRRDPNMLG